MSSTRTNLFFLNQEVIKSERTTLLSVRSSAALSLQIRSVTSVIQYSQFSLKIHVKDFSLNAAKHLCLFEALTQCDGEIDSLHESSIIQG